MTSFVRQMRARSGPVPFRWLSLTILVMGCMLSAAPHGFAGDTVLDKARRFVSGIDMPDALGLLPDFSSRPKATPLKFSAGWMGARKGGLFLDSEGENVSVKAGKADGVQSRNPTQGFWTGFSQQYALREGMNLRLESWFVLPSERKGFVVLPQMEDMRSKPDMRSGISIKKSF